MFGSGSLSIQCRTRPLESKSLSRSAVSITASKRVGMNTSSIS
jgi:hypothetical protein